MRRIWLALLLVGALLTPALGQPGTTTRVSVSSLGEQGDGGGSYDGPSISADGRFVAFVSPATNHVPDDTNGFYDVFVHDRQTGQTSRVSVSSSGEQGNGDTISQSISADGRYVAFASSASNLVADDTNGWEDVFVHDLQTGETTRVSVSSTGAQGNWYSQQPSINANGRYVTFGSHARNLVAGDTNGVYDVFVHDRQTGQTSRVSLSSTGGQGNNASSNASISADGRFVAFSAVASNLVAGDTNFEADVFVHDRQTAQTSRVSVSSAGGEANHRSIMGAISANGRHVVFHSEASNLVADDTNGFDDVFVHDQQTGQTSRVSLSSTGGQGDDHCGYASISADGQYVSFSGPSDLLPDGKNDWMRAIFVRDRQTGQTTRVSVSSSGEHDNWGGYYSSISANGRYVAFESAGSNLVAGDTNFEADVFVRRYWKTPRLISPHR